MRTIRFFFIGLILSLALPLTAQDQPAEPFELDAEDTTAPMVIPEPVSPDLETNETAEVVMTEEELLAEKLSFLAGTAIQYFDEGEHEEAERAYLRALEADPGNAELNFRLSTLYIKMDRYPEALSLLHALAKAFPDDPQVHNNLAWCYATGPGVKNKKLALWHAREALLLNPTTPSIWNTLAEAHYVAGDYESALQASEYAIEMLGRYQGYEPQKKEFQEQRMKILRAQQALKRFDGLDDDE